MGDFTVEEMLAMQQALQEKYKDKWELIGPEAGKHKLLWMLGEVGEVIDIIKKNGDKTAVEDAAIRQHLVAEMEVFIQIKIKIRIESRLACKFALAVLIIAAHIPHRI